nr:DUF6138 family protein [Paenibacillus tengchongensis]
MTHTLEAILIEMKQEIDKWIASISAKDAGQIVKRTPLQAGIHDYALLEYENGRVDVTDDGLDLSFSRKNKPGPAEPLTEQQVREYIVPELAQYMQHQINILPPAVIDYRFTFEGKFRVSSGFVHVRILDSVDEAKKQWLQDQISHYISNKLNAGNYPTKPLESFFLARHLLDEGLFPVLESARIIEIFEKILELNKGNQHLAEHRSTLTGALRRWAEDRWLPRYFENTGTEWQREYQKKSGVQPDNTDLSSFELVLYAAVCILKYEPSYSRNVGLTFLNCAIELGSTQAKQLMKHGSGTFAEEDTRLRSELAECSANDVFAEISVHMKQESAESYALVLRFLIHLLKQGFPKSYQIKLKSPAKHWLPVKGLAKSGTHRFFANALEYPELHPLLEEYAGAAMETYEWYTDTEGEKNCMPGTYAVFGLGLADRRYFPLVLQYMVKVDVEHQLVQDKFIAAFADHYGIHEETLPVLVTSMLYSSDSLKLKLSGAFEDEKLLGLLLHTVRGLECYQVEHLVYVIWGGTDKLKKLADQAGGQQQGLLELIGATRRR